MKNIVITGSTRGIGFSLGEQFLRAGCNVTISGTSDKSVERALLKLTSFKQKVFGEVCDVSQYRQVEHLWKASKEKWGSVDIWINNAGLGQEPVKVWEMSPDKIMDLVKVNIAGLVFGSKAAMLGMLEQEHGGIYNMEGFGSNGMMGNGINMYGTTKRAVRHFTRALAMEAKDSGILVGTLSPGMVLTDLLLKNLKKDGADAERFKKVLNILADTPGTVTRFLAKRILANRKHGVRIDWLPGYKIFGRFLLSVLKKRKLVE